MRKQGLKIIAIKALTGCSKAYTKVLTVNQPYFFYSNYTIDSRDRIKCMDPLPEDFFNPHGIQINMSAIVGKNGSGKSSLIELLIRVINNISYNHRKYLTADLTHIPNLRADLYIYAEKFYKVRVIGYKVILYPYNASGNRLEPVKSKNILDRLFYTIAVNYSHYAYNTSDLILKEGPWLDGLFHKNDGYQTPIVINPMRKNGDININSENHLVTTRLVSNLIRSHKNGDFSFRKITDHLHAFSLQLKLNPSKNDKVIYEIVKNKKLEKINLNYLIKIDKVKVLRALNRKFSFGYNTMDRKKYAIALDYLVYKLVSIAVKYSEYEIYYLKTTENFNEPLLPEYATKLLEDTSHISFKLRQTLHFLKNKHIKLLDQKIDLERFANRIVTLTRRRKRKYNIIEFVPPPIFTMEILLHDPVKPKIIIPLSSISSGEKQMTYSVSSLLYHLSNLESINAVGKKLAYRHVNIILEEIELYFHPEMQRTYIRHIINSINNIGLRKTKSLNFCFVTHSPFILSDIPNKNILFLDEKGMPVSNPIKRTFGGNIFELLAHSFFLKKGLLGEFAKKRIEDILDTLDPDPDQLQESKFSPESILQQINLIGESFLREKLLEMFYTRFENRKHIKVLEDQIKRLKQ